MQLLGNNVSIPQDKCYLDSLPPVQPDTVGELLLSLNKQQCGIYRSRSQDLIFAADLNVARVSAWLDRKLRAKMHVSRIHCSCF